MFKADKVFDMRFQVEDKEVRDRLDFLSEFFTSFTENIHTDIMVRPGNNGTPIPAHRALLAIRSNIFKTMLGSDECKAPAGESITLPELNYEELESLLEFLYSGSLTKEKIEKNVYALSLAADKYDIPFLQKLCEKQMLGSLNTNNVLNVLEISDVCSSKILEESLNFMVKNEEDIIFSEQFDDFAEKNPHLVAKIMRKIIPGIKLLRT